MQTEQGPALTSQKLFGHADERKQMFAQLNSNFAPHRIKRNRSNDKAFSHTQQPMRYSQTVRSSIET